MAEPMKFAYADPPYLGTAKRTYGKAHPEAAAYDTIEAHAALVERLQREFPDGWALSCHEPSLRHILPLCPDEARVGAWCTRASKLPVTATIGRHWEPVIWIGGRSGPRRAGDVVTTLASGPIRSVEARANRCSSSFRDIDRGGRQLLGGKPAAFCEWIFDLLGAGPGDEFHDLFPGSGAVSAAWAKRIGAQPDLPLTPLERAAAAQEMPRNREASVTP